MKQQTFAHQALLLWFTQVSRILERELGSTRMAQIAQIDAQPMATATIAQVVLKAAVQEVECNL